VLLGVALVVVLPAKPRRVVALVGGVGLGLVAVWKIIDLGFATALARPFNPMFDWALFEPAVGFLMGSAGRAGAIIAIIGAVGLAVAVLVLVPLSVLRLTRVVVRHRTSAIRVATVLGVAWLALAVAGAQIVPGVPVAAHNYDRVYQLGASVRDRDAFATEIVIDAFAGVPGEELLTALRGKDVIVTFVESYGRDAVEDPEFAPEVGGLLEDGNRRLQAAGFGSRSAFLTSPTVGGASWFAHETLLSGLWIDNQQRHRTLVESDRLTLNGAFRRAGWRTVGVMPGISQEWPEGEFFGYDRIYDAHQLGFAPQRLIWAAIPDQYTLAAFQRLERARPDHQPVMVEIPLISSHAPWTPIPEFVDWDELGDGSIFEDMASTGDSPDVVLRDPERARTEYRRAIEYTVGALISYVETYGDDDLVLILLGDHQPAPLITGEDASRDVPITIVAGDPAVLDQISGWGWQAGLKPGPQAPVWPMDAFRDQFLAAFGPQPAPDLPQALDPVP
jgi:hypothetical protein